MRTVRSLLSAGAVFTGLLVAAPASAQSGIEPPPPASAPAAAVSAEPLAETPALPRIDWLDVAPQALTHWTRVEDPENPSRVFFRSRWVDVASGPQHRILVLMPKPSRSYEVAVAKIMEVLAEKRIAAELVAMDFNEDPTLGRIALTWAEANGVDLIMAMGSAAVSFVHDTYRGGALPVVTSTAKDPVLMGQMADYERGSGTNIAYTSINMPMDTQIAYLRQLKPDLANVGVMYNKQNESAVRTQVEPLVAAARGEDFRVIHVTVDGPESAVADLKESIPQAIEQMRQNDPDLGNSVFWITGSTAVFSNVATINQYASNVPVISALPNVVKEGEDSAVLSIGVDERTNAHLAVIYALDILNGHAEPGELPVGLVTPPDIAVNFRIARRIRLRLPFSFFESATFVYNYDGEMVRKFGQNLVSAQ